MRNWILLVRPKTLFASLSPVMIALFYAHSQGKLSDIIIALLTLLTALVLQISTNIINDYYDAKSGVDTEKRLGPTRISQSNLIPLEKIKHAFIITLSISFMLGIYLMFQGGLFIVIIGVLSLFFAWAYTGGPYPLAYYGLGEILAFIFFGPIPVIGTYYLQTKSINIDICYYSIFPGLISTLLMGVNNYRDTYTDKLSGKKTISTTIGPKAFKKVLILIIILLALLPIAGIFYFENILQFPIALFCILLFIKNWKKLYFLPISSQLNEVLASCGKFLFIYSLGLSISCII